MSQIPNTADSIDSKTIDDESFDELREFQARERIRQTKFFRLVKTGSVVSGLCGAAMLTFSDASVLKFGGLLLLAAGGYTFIRALQLSAKDPFE